MSEDEGFLQRWSRRKHSARDDSPATEEAAPESAAAPQDLEPDAAAAEDADRSGAEALETQAQPEQPAEEPEPPGDEDMPPLESIDDGGSVEPFFSPRVSEGLRQAALRRLFRQPKYNVVDMLDDYAEDYSNPVALGNIVTADMRYRAEQAVKRMERKYKESLADQESASDRPDEAVESDELASTTAEHDAEAPEVEASAEDQALSPDDSQSLADVDHPAESDPEAPGNSGRQPG